MNCQDFEITVRDLARAQHNRRADSASLPNDYPEALSHANDCDVCSLRLQDERELNRGLEAVTIEIDRYEPALQVEARVLQSYREMFSVAGSSQSVHLTSQKRAFGVVNYGLAAAAALMLLVFGVVLVRSRLTAPLAAEAGARPTLEAPVEPDKPFSAGNAVPNPLRPTTQASIALKDHDKAGAQLQRRSRRSPARLPADEDNSKLQTAASNMTTTGTEREPEIATQFIALSLVGPANLQDGGQIVRVELSRSAMASFGFPVNMDRFGETVKADVLVSADGFARAIRFVQ